MGKKIIASRIIEGDDVPKHFIDLVEAQLLEMKEAKRCVEVLGRGGGVTVNIPDENAIVEYKTLVKGEKYLVERFEL